MKTIEERRAYQKARILAMTPEQRKAFYRKNYEYTTRKKEFTRKHIENAIKFLKKQGYIVYK